MLDRYAIKIIKWPLKTLAALPDKLGISANQVTITGFIIDFIFYSLVPFGFVLADPNNNAIAGAFLIYSFIGTGSSFLAFAIMAGKRNIESPVYKQKSLYYIGGLTEGTETIACFVLFCLFPSYFSIIAWIFGALCWVTTATRIWAGYQTLKQQP